MPNGGQIYGVVRKSSDQGNTWSTVDTFQDMPLISGSGNGVKSIVTDTSGNVYVAGSNGGWIVRKSSNEGSTWTTVDSYQSTPGRAASANAITLDNSGKIYAAGFGTNSSNMWQWIVRKRSNAGTMWSTVDFYNLDSGHFALPNAISADSSGNVYTAGFEGAFSPGVFYPPSNWIVRKGTNHGNAWATVDSSPTREIGAMASAITVDTSGNVYVAGYSHNNWTVKKSFNTGTTWTIIDSFGGGWGPAGAASASGKIYVTGMAGNDWLTRILSL